MSVHRNHLGQPVGEPLPDWTERPRPPRTAIDGRFCRVEPLDPDRHADDLFEANADDTEGRNWTYLAYGPFATLDGYRAWMRAACAGDDPLFHAILDREPDGAPGRAVGIASLMRIDPISGVMEVGHINLSPRLQRRAAATEALFLLMRRAFDELGYRRFEWKCDALNAPSRAAAERLGFRNEGLFRQAAVYKGRNRDTAWFSIVDGEWPALRAAFEVWLDPANFEADGRQRRSLRTLTAAADGP